ncbi:MAG TPA: glycerol-3-phosphate 1-O-acyltransferase PlsY [Patescibacteria group bacterium]|nr:glycerol-3-phosphate 1-O-acyltransferase PlsY [Patescibacteria group bacterium]
MELIWRIVLVVVPSYGIGAIPSSYIVGTVFHGIDLREHGSRNLGAANTYRVLGARSAVPVLMFDILKGFVAVRVFAGFGGQDFLFPLLAAFFVVLGHNYSIFVRFSGGKGVATTAGAFLALVPYAVVMSFVLWSAVLLIFRIVSVASMAGTVFLAPAILISDRYFGSRTHPSIIVLAIIAAILVIYKHRSNIQRLLRGEEKKLFGNGNTAKNKKEPG